MSVSAEARREAFVRKAGEGKPIHVIGDEVTIKISSQDTGGAFAVFEGRTRPMSGPPLHCHRDQDEWWYVLEGEYIFEVDGVEIRAGAGDTVFAPRGSHHTFQNVGSTMARVVTTVVPGGLDLFFEELERVVPRGSGAPDPARMIPIFEEHNLELLGPPRAARTEGYTRKESD